MNKVGQPAAFHEIIDIRYTIWQHNYQNKHCVCCGKMHIRIIPLDYQQVPQYLFINWHNLLSTYLKLYRNHHLSPSWICKKNIPNPKTPRCTNQSNRTFATHLEDPVIRREGYVGALCATNSSPSRPSAISLSTTNYWKYKVFLSTSPPLLLELSSPTGKAVSRRCAYMLKGVKNEVLAIVAQQTVLLFTLILSELEQALQPKIYVLDITNNRVNNPVTKRVTLNPWTHVAIWFSKDFEMDSTSDTRKIFNPFQ